MENRIGIYSFLWETTNQSSLFWYPIEELIDNEKLNKIDGRKLLPIILKNSQLNRTQKEIITKRKRKINQQNALKAHRLREQYSFQNLEKEIILKQIEKETLLTEVQELTNEIQAFQRELSIEYLNV